MEEIILACYDEIAEASAAMLVCAREGDWDRLVKAEAQVARTIERLQAFGDPSLMSPEGNKHRMKVLRQVLAQDSEIRRLTQSWVDTLETFLTGRSTQRRLEQAYR